jgi:hypothetical protein
LLSPYQDRVIGLIPFVGDTDSANVDYRQRLFDTSLVVIKQNPWFGGGDYIGQLGDLGMVQGEGIVDLVNTYLAVALSQGLIGLALFLESFARVDLVVEVVNRNNNSKSAAFAVAFFVALVVVWATGGEVASALGLALAAWLILGAACEFAERTALFRQSPRDSWRRAVNLPRSAIGAMIARRLGTRIWLSRCTRIGTECRFRVEIVELRVPRTANQSEDIRTIMVEMQKQFEAWVRETPEQWMWSNRRWS